MEYSNSYAGAFRGPDAEAAAGRDVRQLLEPLVRRWYVVLAVALLVSALSYAYFRNQAASYTAGTSVFLQTSVESTLTPGAPVGDPERIAANQARLARTPAVAELAARRLGFQGDPRALLPLVQVTTDADSDFLTIEGTAGDPKRAAEVANAFAGAFVELGTTRIRNEATKESAAIERELAELPPTRENGALRRELQNRLRRTTLVLTVPPQGARQVDRATSAATAGTPSPARNAIFAGILGLILGAVLAHGLEALQRRVPSSAAEEAYGLPLLASVPRDRKAVAQSLEGPERPAVMEPVRTVRTRLEHGSIGGPPPRTILVTSAVQGEGKSTITRSLAMGYFQAGRRVLIIDGDLRQPVLHEFFGVQPEPGLADVLLSGSTLQESVQPIQFDGEVYAPLDASVVYFDAENPGSDLVPVTRVDPQVTSKPTATSRRGEVGTHSGNGSERVSSPTGGKAPDGRIGARPGSEDGSRIGSMLDLLPTLDLLPCGSWTSDPAALLGSGRMARVLAEAAESYDVVLVDSPPFLAVSDGIPLARAVDGVVVVTRPDLTTRDAAERLRVALDRLPQVRVLGLVANGVRRSGFGRHDRYAGYA